jgi:hypothetical protein
MEGRNEEKEVRCPKLGHNISLPYCRKEAMGLPCERFLVCWGPWPNVIESLRRELTCEEWERCFNRPPRNKIETILEIMEKAKKIKELKEGDET